MGNGCVQGWTPAFVHTNDPSLSLFLHLSYPHDWQLRLEKGDKVTQKFKSSAFRPQYTPNSCLDLIEKHGGWGGKFSGNSLPQCKRKVIIWSCIKGFLCQFYYHDNSVDPNSKRIEEDRCSIQLMKMSSTFPHSTHIFRFIMYALIQFTHSNLFYRLMVSTG